MQNPMIGLASDSVCARHRRHVIHRGGDGFFEQQLHTVPHRRDGRSTVNVIWTGDNDRVHTGLFDQPLHRCRKSSARPPAKMREARSGRIADRCPRRQRKSLGSRLDCLKLWRYQTPRNRTQSSQGDKGLLIWLQYIQFATEYNLNLRLTQLCRTTGANNIFSLRFC